MKAAIAAWHLPACVVGVPGVSNWRGVTAILPKKIPVVIAYDMDTFTNRTVERHQLDLSRTLFWAGHPVAIATWDCQFKGIDDALLAGATIEQRAWPTGVIVEAK